MANWYYPFPSSFICGCIYSFSLLYETEDMTTSPTPTSKLDPNALAETVPLRRVGTPEVRIIHLSHDVMGTYIYIYICRTWQVPSFSWRVGLAPMSMALCGSLMVAELAQCQVTIKIHSAARCTYSLDFCWISVGTWMEYCIIGVYIYVLLISI